MSHLQLVPPSDPAEIVKPENVRLASMRDEPAILDLLLADLAENAEQVAPVHIPRLTDLIASCTRHRSGFALVIDSLATQEPIAVALLQIAQWWWSDRIYLHETVLYVAPEARHGRAGADLIQAEKWLSQDMSKEAGERVFLMAGVTATRRMEAKLRLYGRHLTQVGGFFIHPPIEGISL